MNVAKLTYFKPSGKYYTEGYLETNREHDFEFWEDVKIMCKHGLLPHIQSGWWEGTVLVETPGGVPALIVSEGES